MLHHYTALSAMKSILKYVATMGTMCFWATRYYYFADKREFELLNFAPFYTNNC